MIRINQKYALLTSLYTLISLILYFSINYLIGVEYQTALRIIGMGILIQFILNFFVYFLMEIDFFSLSGSFTWLNYFFHLGQPVVKFLAPSFRLNFDVSQTVVNEVFIESLSYSYLMIVMVSVGILFLKTFEKKFVHKEYKLSNLTNENLFKIGLLIFATTFPIEAYIQLTKIFVATTSGYLATFEVGISGIVGFISNFSLVGAIIMLLGSKDNRKRGNIIMIFYGLFYVVAMFSGGRMWQVIKLLLVFYYYKEIYRIKVTKKTMLILVVVGYFAAGFMSAVADFRSYDIQSEGYIVQILQDVFRNNPIFNILDEFGGTVYTVSLTIQKTMYELPFSFGKQFITNFVSIFPNLTAGMAAINDNSNYVLLLKTPWIGGSFVGEMFYSFGYFAVLPAFIVGAIAQYLTEKIERGIKNNDYHIIIYTLMFQYSFISWIRGSSAIFYRNTAFGIVLVYIITSFFIREKERNTSYQSKDRLKRERMDGING